MKTGFQQFLKNGVVVISIMFFFTPVGITECSFLRMPGVAAKNLSDESGVCGRKKRHRLAF
ncbi:MAG: hypothetical protein LBL16_01585 [Endomicrobium sp.]|jgi:hypothetical protein|nr:hypothetical protein [Endomicrobium sp.]